MEPARGQSGSHDGQPRQKWKGLFLVLALAFVVITTIVVSGWFVFLVARASWQDPFVLLLVIVGIGAFLLFLRRLRRIAAAEIERFETRPHSGDADFLSQLGLNPTAAEAQVALVARRVFAELGCVPADSLHASDRFYPDMAKLPFYDSIDSLEIVLRLEKELKIRLSGEDGERILCRVNEQVEFRRTRTIRNGSATVGEAVQEVVRLWHAQQDRAGTEAD